MEASGVNYEATLRLSATAGVELSTPDFLDFFSDFGAGIFVGVHANVVQFTGAVSGADGGSDTCAFYMDATYQFGVGGAAGAYAFVEDDVYAAVAETNIPIWGTSVGSICATRGDVLERRSVPTELHGRQDMSTTTTETERTYTGTQCLSTAMTECPPALQTVRKFSTTETLTTAVPSGEDVDWDASPLVTNFDAGSFGQSAFDITSTTGTPKPFDVGHNSDGTTGGVSNKLIIGLSVGLGVPALVGVGILIL